MTASGSFDLAVVGAGIVGLAHALAAAKRGRRVVVIERDARANGASVRNFGFVTVSGQEQTITWPRARRAREIWAEVAPAAGIPIVQRGSLLVARRPEALAVLEEFAAGPMGEGCELLTRTEARARCPELRPRQLEGALLSPHELRIEAREALPRLAAWLEQAHGVQFVWAAAVRSVLPPRIETTRGTIEAGACIACVGDDFLSLFPERLARYPLARTKLHMLRLAPQPPGWRLPAAIMSDLTFARYEGFAACPSAAVLRVRLEQEQPATLANGVHLIVVQSADGSLVVGDSHHTASTPDPFAPAEVDEIILNEADAVLEIADRRVVERWLGVYAAAPDRPALIDAPGPAVRLVIVTSGTGMSTAFAIAEEVVSELFGR